MIKSPAEIDTIRKSVRVNSEAYARTITRVRLGMRERDIAAELDYQMRLHGAEKPAFDTIVAAGARTALPHAHPTSQRLEENDLLLIDMGACLDGYMSDMTRMASLGVPTKASGRCMTRCLRRSWPASNAVRPGVTAAQRGRGGAGSAKNVMDWTGSSSIPPVTAWDSKSMRVPRIGKKDQTELRAGMVITIEPGAYIDGAGR